MAEKTIEFPESVFATTETLCDLEDWRAVTDPHFIQDIRRIREQEDQAGRGKDPSELLARWPIES